MVRFSSFNHVLVLRWRGKLGHKKNNSRPIVPSATPSTNANPLAAAAIYLPLPVRLRSRSARSTSPPPLPPNRCREPASRTYHFKNAFSSDTRGSGSSAPSTKPRLFSESTAAFSYPVYVNWPPLTDVWCINSNHPQALGRLPCLYL